MRDKGYLRSDIQCVLKSLGLSSVRMANVIATLEVDHFNAGFISALIAVADAFGVEFSSAPAHIPSVFTHPNSGEIDSQKANESIDAPKKNFEFPR